MIDHMLFTRFIKCVLFMGVGLCVMACSTEKVSREAGIDLPDAFSRSGDVETPNRWWKSFEDRELNWLVESSFTGNLDIKTAWDRLGRSMAIARREGANLYPRVEASGNFSRDVSEGGSGTIVGGSFVSGGGSERTYSNEYTFNLSADYEVDVWGRVRAATQAAEQEVNASVEDIRATALSVAAQVADVWYRLVERRARLELLNEQIQINERYLELVKNRFEIGAVSATDVLQQRNLLASTRTDLHRIRADIATLEHQLAVLQGNVPEQMNVPEQSTLPEIPPRPDTGIPARWIRKRPDIRAAFSRVKSADREVASAIANRFPRLSITPRYRSDAETPSDLFETWTARLAINLMQPLFDAGRRKAEVERARAEKKEQIHSYARTVLIGIREVEDALSNEVQQEKRVSGLRDQLELSRQSVEQLIERYRNGAVNYLRVLDEVRNQQQLQRELLAARGQLVRFRIDLYEALAGSWDLPVPEDVPETITSSEQPLE